MALMRTISPITFVELKRWMAAKAPNRPEPKRRLAQEGQGIGAQWRRSRGGLSGGRASARRPVVIDDPNAFVKKSSVPKLPDLSVMCAGPVAAEWEAVQACNVRGAFLCARRPGRALAAFISECR